MKIKNMNLILGRDIGYNDIRVINVSEKYLSDRNIMYFIYLDVGKQWLTPINGYPLRTSAIASDYVVSVSDKRYTDATPFEVPTLYTFNIVQDGINGNHNFSITVNRGDISTDDKFLVTLNSLIKASAC